MSIVNVPPASNKTVPWYESNLFWGPAALGVGILLTVVAAMKQDLRWLLWFAAPCFLLVSWSAVKQIERAGLKWLLMSVCFLVICGSLYGMHLWLRPQNPSSARSKERHITSEQKEGLAALRDALPKQCGMLVYVPEDSAESQNYGREIQSGLQLHGARANIIHEGVMATPIGLVVGVHSSFEPCGYAGEMLSGGMGGLHMPTRFVEGFPRTDETTVILFVGIKPPYD